MRKQLAVAGMIIALLSPGLAWADRVQEDPSALAMAGDLVLVRPVLLGITAVGTVFYVASLPFSLLGGNSVQAAQTLVLGPAEATFVRCLGCKRTGYAFSPVED